MCSEVCERVFTVDCPVTEFEVNGSLKGVEGL